MSKTLTFSPPLSSCGRKAGAPPDLPRSTMPSLSLPEDASPAKKTPKGAIFGEAPTIGIMAVEEKKKKKKKQKAAQDGDASAVKKNSKDRKRKLCDEERSETSSDHGEEDAPPPPKKVKASATVSDDDGEVVESGDEEEEVTNPNSVSNFRISGALRERLKSKGIEALFPIQAMTFDLILDGDDLVGRARTGQGKTLAFVLPILESLTNGQNKISRGTGYGRLPSVLVLLPTRELACQVFTDFEFYGGAVGLSSCCLYGGSPYRTQENALHRGVDIVIGTPGRIKDHLERGTLNLKALRFRVLDEADEMLNMGFVDDVELILGKVGDASTVQTLLFSATLPDWVKKISSRFLKSTKKTADLVGNDKLKASASVRHLVLPCSSKARAKLIPDIIQCYSSGGRTIIFTETKESASALAGLLPGARALHGDVVQGQREVILSGFRSGRFLILVATNVAARGLDINDVQLIIQCEPPRDVEAYIHRSGRTGRAGNNGVAILLYEPRYTHAISRIERETGVKFERISAPQPAEMAETAGSVAADAISSVSDSVIPIFKAQAEHLLSSTGLSAVDLLAKALAKSAGYTEIKKRSLLSSLEDSVTLLLEPGRPMYTPSFAYGILRRVLPEEKIEDLKGLALTADGMGAIFDVSTDDVDLFIKASGNGISIKELDELPPLQDKPQARGGFGGRGRFGGHGAGRGGGFSNRFGRGGGGNNSFGNQSRGFSNTRGRGGRFRQ